MKDVVLFRSGGYFLVRSRNECVTEATGSLILERKLRNGLSGMAWLPGTVGCGLDGLRFGYRGPIIWGEASSSGRSGPDGWIERWIPCIIRRHGWMMAKSRPVERFSPERTHCQDISCAAARSQSAQAGNSVREGPKEPFISTRCE